MITNKDFMLCESIREEDLSNAFKDGEWKANIKFDGERIVVIKNNDDVFLLNRAGRIKNQIYPELIEDLKNANACNFILDSEVITTNGIFNSLQHRSNLSDRNKIERAKIDYPIKLMVFDLIYFEKDLRQMPLKERIKILNENFKTLNLVEYQEIQIALNYAKEHKLEGIVIKNMNSNYEGKRSKNWVKLKLFKEDNFKAISYTINNAGIRVEDIKLNACQIAGSQSIEVKNEIDNKGFCEIIIQYLEKTKDDRYRFISFKEMVK